jgi:hypothetical protein
MYSYQEAFPEAFAPSDLPVFHLRLLFLASLSQCLYPVVAQPRACSSEPNHAMKISCGAWLEARKQTLPLGVAPCAYPLDLQFAVPTNRRQLCDKLPTSIPLNFCMREYGAQSLNNRQIMYSPEMLWHSRAAPRSVCFQSNTGSPVQVNNKSLNLNEEDAAFTSTLG